jgi:hypothetical protein
MLKMLHYSLFWNLNVTLINLVNHFARVPPFYCASHGHTGAQNLLASTGKSLCTRARFHYSSDLDDVIELEVSIVLDVLVLHKHYPGFSLLLSQ